MRGRGVCRSSLACALCSHSNSSGSAANTVAGFRSLGSSAATIRCADQCSQGYELLNARIEWSSAEDNWRVALGATNLTDEEYFLNKFDLTAFGQPSLEGQPGAPREWYIQFQRNFN